MSELANFGSYSQRFKALFDFYDMTVAPNLLLTAMDQQNRTFHVPPSWYKLWDWWTKSAVYGSPGFRVNYYQRTIRIPLYAPLAVPPFEYRRYTTTGGLLQAGWLWPVTASSHRVVKHVGGILEWIAGVEAWWGNYGAVSNLDLIACTSSQGEIISCFFLFFLYSVPQI